MKKQKSGAGKTKKCEVCKKMFDPKVRKCSDVCSPKCAKVKKSRQDAKTKKGRGVVGSKVKCKREGCNVVFEKRSGTHCYCTDHCHYLAKREREANEQVRVLCVWCKEHFMRSKYSKRETCCEDCLTEYKKTVQPNKKKKKEEILDTKPWAHCIATEFFEMETGCSEFRSYDCPEMDPLTMRHMATVEEVWAISEPKRRRKAA